MMVIMAKQFLFGVIKPQEMKVHVTEGICFVFCFFWSSGFLFAEWPFIGIMVGLSNRVQIVWADERNTFKHLEILQGKLDVKLYSSNTLTD